MSDGPIGEARVVCCNVLVIVEVTGLAKIAEVDTSAERNVLVDSKAGFPMALARLDVEAMIIGVYPLFVG